MENPDEPHGPLATPSHESSVCSPATHERADYFLLAIRNTISHDIPNLLVGLLGWLNLLKTEEMGHLSEEGQTSLERAHALSGRLSNSLTILKEMFRVYGEPTNAEPIPLGDFVKELNVACQIPFARVQLDISVCLPAPIVHAPPYLLRRSLLALIHYLLAGQVRNIWQGYLETRLLPWGVELGVGNSAQAVRSILADNRASGAAEYNQSSNQTFWVGPSIPPRSAEDNLHLVLAQICAQGWNGSVRGQALSDTEIAFRLNFPNREF